MTILNDDGKPCRLPEIPKADIISARRFIQSKVNNWCKTKPNDKFRARDLVGKIELCDWTGTPLQPLHDYRFAKNKETAFKTAAIDVGWLLKCIIRKDRRVFESGVDMVRFYKLKK